MSDHTFISIYMLRQEVVQYVQTVKEKKAFDPQRYSRESIKDEEIIKKLPRLNIGDLSPISC